jgi:hypothetical protein
VLRPLVPTKNSIAGILMNNKLWDRVNKTETCWLWTGGKDPNGYGVVRIEGKARSTHRLAYEEIKGPVPKGLVIMHTCDVPYCVNPSHLVAGTYAENSRDMVEKGRHRWGKNRPA